MVPIRYGPQLVLLLHHPDLIEEVLVTRQRDFAKGRFYRILGPLLGEGLLTSEGDAWRRNRRLAQPAFHRARVAAYGQTMVDATERLLEGWRPGAVRDVHADMMRLTLNIVVKTLLDADVEGEAAAVGEALPAALRELDGLMNGPAFLLPQALPTPGKRRLARAVRRLDAVVYRIIALAPASRPGRSLQAAAGPPPVAAARQGPRRRPHHCCEGPLTTSRVLATPTPGRGCTP